MVRRVAFQWRTSEEVCFSSKSDVCIIPDDNLISSGFPAGCQPAGRVELRRRWRTLEVACLSNTLFIRRAFSRRHSCLATQQCLPLHPTADTWTIGCVSATSFDAALTAKLSNVSVNIFGIILNILVQFFNLKMYKNVEKCLIKLLKNVKVFLGDSFLMSKRPN